MRILHITTYLQGGAGRIILDLLLKQRAAGHQVAIVMNKTSESDYLSYPEYMQILEKEQIPFIEVDSTFKRDLSQNINAITEIQQLLDQSPFDVIHAHAAIPALIGIVARSGRWPYIPVIQTMHGWGLKKSPLQERMDVSIMNSLDKVVTVSLSDQHLLEEKGVKQKQLTTIYNGIQEIGEENFKNPQFEEIQDFKKKGYQIIGCIGSVCERKNQSLLIEALKSLPNKEQIKCIFIGEGDLISHLQDKTKIDGIEHLVKFYGYQKNGKQFLKLFDWMVMPSKSEGLALVFLEAFQMKVPVLASNIPVFKEVLEEGVTGYLFESDSVLALSNKLEKLLSLSRESLQPLLERAYSKFQSLFTTDVMVKNYENLYAQVVSK